MFVDFVTLALDQLVNQAAKAHFMSGGQLTVPLVLRTQGGAGQRGAAQHSQSLEAWLTHVPGLKVVMPSTAADAAGLLASAIADPNPVVFVENKTLYFRKEDVPDEPSRFRIGRARIVRPGRDVTVVALSRLVSESLAAADELAADGIEVEVIDPRTLVPLDLETIVESVTRTHRLVVAHEAVAHGGFGAEIAAQVQEAAFDELDAPIGRVGAPFAPVPFSPPLEDAYLPGTGRRGRCRASDARPLTEGESECSDCLTCLLNARSGDDRLGRMSILGNRVLRKEDPRFLRGEATYVENLPLEGALTVTFVRSLLAHARIVGVDTSAAEALPDVQVFTGDDVDVTTGPPPIPVLEQRMTTPGRRQGRRSLRRRHRRRRREPGPRHGRRRRRARGGRVRPAARRGRHGRGGEGRGLLFPEVGTNVAGRAGRMDHDQQLFEGCEVVVSDTIVSQRMAGCPLEVRSAAAQVDADGRVTAWLSTQVPHRDHFGITATLGMEPGQLRVIAPDVGGGFGAKSAFGAEEALIVWLARHLGSPSAGRRRGARA